VSSLLFDAARRVAEHSSHAAGVGVVAVLLFVVLVVERELVRSLAGPQLARRMQALSVITAPLLLVFVFLLGVRYARLL
jgi:hypothetical protein